MASELERFYKAKEKAGLNGDYGYDNDGNLTFTIKPNLIVNTYPDSNFLKILLKSGKEIKLDLLFFSSK